MIAAAPSVLFAWALAATPGVELEVVVSDGLDRLDVRSTETFVPAKNAEHIELLLAAERYRSEPDVRPWQVRELYPSTFSPGGFDSVSVEIEGQVCRASPELLPEGGAVLRCPFSVVAGRAVTVHARTEVRVPERYGVFGRVGRQLTLAGGYYPEVSSEDRPHRRTHRLRVSVPGGFVAVLGDRWFPLGASQGRRSLEAQLEDVAQAVLILRPPTVRPVSVLDGAARFVTGPGSSTQLRSEWTVALSETVTAMEDGLRFLAENGVWKATSERPVVVVETPLRHHLAQAVEGVVLISDHAFRMVPVDRFLRFHRFPLLRELFGLVMRGQLQETSGHRRHLAEDAAAAYLLERYVAERFGEKEDAFDILSPFAFIPSIDSMLYAPDLPFVEAYFRLVREDDALFEDFAQYPKPSPRGRILYEKLVDLLGRPRAQTHFARALSRGTLFPALTEALGEESQIFFEQWLGPYPNVRYALESFGSAASPELPSGHVRAFAVVERSGDSVSEPIPVLFEAEDGTSRLVIAPPSLEVRRTVTATLSAPLDLVEIDPHGRLAESPTLELSQPRLDNRSRPRWRILLNNWNLQVAATAGQVNTAIDLGFARRYDNRWRLGLRADYRPDSISGTLRGTYGFGRAVNANQLAHWLGVSLAGGYLRPGFAEQVEDGFATQATLYYGYDGRSSPWAPQTASAVRLAASYNRVFGEAPGTSTPDSLSVSARFLTQLRLDLRHLISLRLSASAYLTGEPRSQLLFSAGGRGNVRGYAVEDDVARLRGVASLEWLHPLLPRWEEDGFFLAWVNGLDGALFADLAVMADRFEELDETPVLADVGYGLRLYIDYGGVRPGVLAVELAFPLVQTRNQDALGPPALYIDFTQSFLAF